MLHLTKVAFGVDSLDDLIARWRARIDEPPYALGTRYLPKRADEIAGKGSLYWILKHQLVARSPIVGFEERDGGRHAILLDPALVLVAGRPKRAHQGWRYLEAGDAPADLGSAGADGLAQMPPALVGALSALALI